MNVPATLKTLSLLGLTALTLAATGSQADNGYGYYGRPPVVNPWINNVPTPWMASPAYQQAQMAEAMKQRQAQMDQHQDAQMQRILAGMEQGKLTAREAVDLLREHLAIAGLERNYLSDGKLGMNELVNLEQRLAEADRHIQYEKNDRERLPVGLMGRPADFGRHGDNDRH
jgi:hypothetical protein